MSRAGFPSQNLSPPQTYDTMQGKRRDSPILQEQNQTGTGRSGQSSPANQSNTPPPMNTKGPPQGSVCNQLDIKTFSRLFVILSESFVQYEFSSIVMTTNTDCIKNVWSMMRWEKYCMCVGRVKFELLVYMLYFPIFLL